MATKDPNTSNAINDLQSQESFFQLNKIKNAA